METKPFKLYSLADPAVDAESMGDDCKKYLTDRDIALVKVLPGSTPTVFECRDIRSSAYDYVMDGATEAEQNKRAFRVGVVKVANLVDQSGDKLGAVLPTGRLQTPAGGARFWTDEEIDLVAPVFIQDIGSVLKARGALPFGCTVSFRPPPLLLQVLLAKISHRAEEIHGSLQESSEEAKARARRPSSPDGDEGTDARATASPT